MYSDNHNKNSARRSDTEFLRRMRGGELTGDGFRSIRIPGTAADGITPQPIGGMTNPQNGTTPQNEGRFSPPPAENTCGCGCNQESESTCGSRNPGSSCNSCSNPPATPCPENNCPTTIPAPSLAMVYCPRQCWRRILNPAEGLSAGSIFEELLLPLKAKNQKPMREGEKSRCRL